MDNNIDNTRGNKDLAENGIVITEAMIEAGARAMASYDLEKLEFGMGVDREFVKLILLAAHQR